MSRLRCALAEALRFGGSAHAAGVSASQRVG